MQLGPALAVATALVLAPVASLRPQQLGRRSIGLGQPIEDRRPGDHAGLSGVTGRPWTHLDDCSGIACVARATEPESRIGPVQQRCGRNCPVPSESSLGSRRSENSALSSAKILLAALEAVTLGPGRRDSESRARLGPSVPIESDRGRRRTATPRRSPP